MVTTEKTVPSAASAKAATVAPARLAAPVKTAAAAKKPAPKKVVKKAAPRARTPIKKAAPVAVKAVVVKTVTAAVAKPAANAIAEPKAAKPVKEKKAKLVRDSFTVPKAEYNVLDILKLRAAKLGSPAKKSELLRAGIKALAAMTDSAYLAALKAVPAVKTGRPPAK